MKTSASGKGNIDRTTTATLHRTSKPPKPMTPLEVTNFNVGVIGRKSEAKEKTIQSKPASKAEFNVEVNMTESKIFQAKQGLMLLKRKMNRTGMSRQKNHSNSEKTEDNRALSSTNLSKQQLPQRMSKQKRTVPVSKNQQNIPEFTVNTNSRQGVSSTAKVTKERISSVVVNQYSDERPIAKNTNFMDLLEREMKKQENLKVKPSQAQQAHRQPSLSKNKIIDDNGNQVILEVCSKGCGRMFHPDTLGKHEKVCEKVFQSKRKAFNSAMHRQVQAEYQPKPVAKQEVKQKKKNQIPKWKLDSLAFRAGLKQGKNQVLTKQQEKVIQLTQDNLLKMCQFCGRKFNEEASKKHVPFCQKKSKELSKAKTTKKK